MIATFELTHIHVRSGLIEVRLGFAWTVYRSSGMKGQRVTTHEAFYYSQRSALSALHCSKYPPRDMPLEEDSSWPPPSRRDDPITLHISTRLAKSSPL